MSVIIRGSEDFRPTPRFGYATAEPNIYSKRRSQPRPQPLQKKASYISGPSNVPPERPCSYDFPCKADCFNHGASTRPSGRYARTVRHPGESPPVVSPCQAFTFPSPPYHPCCYHTCNKF